MLSWLVFYYLFLINDAWDWLQVSVSCNEVHGRLLIKKGLEGAINAWSYGKMIKNVIVTSGQLEEECEHEHDE